MGHSAVGTAASQAGPPGPQLPGTVRLAGMLTLSCLASQAGQTIVAFAGELDTASADQADGYVRDAIDVRGGQVPDGATLGRGLGLPRLPGNRPPCLA